MAKITRLKNDESFQIGCGSWIFKPLVIARYGFTEDQLKRCRSLYWFEGVHFRYNPAKAIVYNPLKIDEWLSSNPDIKG